MGLKKCLKCGELADEAKAFCPECGNSFENETARKEDSEFELSHGTMRMTGSAFDLMLSDMGLNISGISDDEDKNEPAQVSPDAEGNTEAEKSRPVMRSPFFLTGIAIMTLIVAAIVALVYVLYFR